MGDSYYQSVLAQRKRREPDGPLIRPWAERLAGQFKEMFAGSPEGKAAYDAGKQAILNGPSQGVDLEKSRVPSSPVGGRRPLSDEIETIRGAIDALDKALPRPARDQMFERGSVTADETRKKRIEQAGIGQPEAPMAPAPVAPQPAPVVMEKPVMAASQQGDTYPPESRFKAEQAVYGGGQIVPSGKTVDARQAAVSAAGPARNDLRGRYLQMAGMGLEQREKFLSRMPEGQRPIHEIRGTQQSWYSPGQSRSFATLPEAVTGIEGRPTYASEEKRAERSAGRGAAAARQQAGFEHQRQMQATELAHKEKLAKEYGVGVKGVSSKGKGVGGEEFVFGPAQTLSDGSAFVPVLDKKSGKNFQIKYGDANDAELLFNSLDLTDDASRGHAFEAFRALSPDQRKAIISKNPEHIKNAMLQEVDKRKKIEAEKNKKPENKKGKEQD